MSKTFNAIIVDDEPIARDIIRTHLEKLPQLIVCLLYTSDAADE